MINPDVLRKLRSARQWTQADLQEKSKVDKQTISMIERGQRTRVRGHTIRALSKALGVEPNVLSGATPISEVEFDHRSTMSVRLDDGPRNALTLAARRYGVSTTAIVELAPFLFTWAAEMSLRQRTERIEQLEAVEQQLQSMQCKFPHLNVLLTYSSDRCEIINTERDNIKTRDIFASKMEDSDIIPVLSEEFEEHEGPIVRFLQGLADQIGSGAEFDSWHPLGGPSYAVCKEEAKAIVGGDKELAEQIIAGNVPLHAMPRELERKERLVDRIAWARGEVTKAAECREGLTNLTIDDLDDISPGAAS